MPPFVKKFIFCFAEVQRGGCGKAREALSSCGGGCFIQWSDRIRLLFILYIVDGGTKRSRAGLRCCAAAAEDAFPPRLFLRRKRAVAVSGVRCRRKKGASFDDLGKTQRRIPTLGTHVSNPAHSLSHGDVFGEKKRPFPPCFFCLRRAVRRGTGLQGFVKAWAVKAGPDRGVRSVGGIAEMARRRPAGSASSASSGLAFSSGDRGRFLTKFFIFCGRP